MTKDDRLNNPVRPPSKAAGTIGADCMREALRAVVVDYKLFGQIQPSTAELCELALKADAGAS